MDFAGQVCAWANRATSFWQFNLPAAPGPRRVLVLQCHPCGDSFGAACAAAAVRGLHAAGHEVRVKTLYDYAPSNSALGSSYYGRDFPPALTAGERRGYHDVANPAHGQAQLDKQLAPEVVAAAADLRWAQGLVGPCVTDRVLTLRAPRAKLLLLGEVAVSPTSLLTLSIPSIAPVQIPAKGGGVPHVVDECPSHAQGIRGSHFPTPRRFPPPRPAPRQSPGPGRRFSERRRRGDGAGSAVDEHRARRGGEHVRCLAAHRHRGGGQRPGHVERRAAAPVRERVHAAMARAVRDGLDERRPAERFPGGGRGRLQGLLMALSLYNQVSMSKGHGALTDLYFARLRRKLRIGPRGPEVVRAPKRALLQIEQLASFLGRSLCIAAQQSDCPCLLPRLTPLQQDLTPGSVVKQNL